MGLLSMSLSSIVPKVCVGTNPTVFTISEIILFWYFYKKYCLVYYQLKSSQNGTFSQLVI